MEMNWQVWEKAVRGKHASNITWELYKAVSGVRENICKLKLLSKRKKDSSIAVLYNSS